MGYIILSQKAPCNFSEHPLDNFHYTNLVNCVAFSFLFCFSIQQIESHPQWDQLEEETQGDEENSDVSDFTTDDEDSND